MTSHLTIDELLAHATGAPTEISTRVHLDSCDACQAELRRWATTAAGVRLLEPPTRPPVSVLDRVFERVDQAPPVPARRTSGVRVALAAAASVALIAAGTYAVTTYARAPSSPPDGTTGGSTNAVAADFVSTECTSLQVVAGTLESVDGTTLVLRTPGGRTVRVTTSDETTINRQLAGSPADVKVGKQVFVNGTGSSGGEAITAERVSVFEPLERVPHGLGRAPNLGRFMVERGNVAGKVTAVDGSGFTVEGVGGVTVRVSTTSKTEVTTQKSVAPAELAVGERTIAVGSRTSDGELAARNVSQGVRDPMPAEVRPNLPRPLPGMTPPARPKLDRGLFDGLGCDARAIATTAMTAAN